jgi:hypothetical protein
MTVGVGGKRNESNFLKSNYHVAHHTAGPTPNLGVQN